MSNVDSAVNTAEGTAAVSLRPGGGTTTVHTYNGAYPTGYGVEARGSAGLNAVSHVSSTDFVTTGFAYGSGGYSYGGGAIHGGGASYSRGSLVMTRDMDSSGLSTEKRMVRVRKPKVEYDIKEVEVPRTIQVPREVFEEVLVPREVAREIVETVMVPKQVPRTVYDTIMVPEERTRTIIETVMVPEQRPRTVMESKTIIETQQYKIPRTIIEKRRVTVTRPKIVTEEIEVEEEAYEEEELLLSEAEILARSLTIHTSSEGRMDMGRMSSSGLVTTGYAIQPGGARGLYGSAGASYPGYASGQQQRGLYGSYGTGHGTTEYITPRGGAVSYSSYNQYHTPSTGYTTTTYGASGMTDSDYMMNKLRADYK